MLISSFDCAVTGFHFADIQPQIIVICKITESLLCNCNNLTPFRNVGQPYLLLSVMCVNAHTKTELKKNGHSLLSYAVLYVGKICLLSTE